MIEKVLLLSNDGEFLATLQKRLKDYGVEVIDAFTDEQQVKLSELRHRYNIIVIDKSFIGHARNACELIQQMRRCGFNDPIVAIERVPYDGVLFSLVVAGCNLALSLFEHGDDDRRLMTAICLLIEKISTTLSEMHQPSS